MENDRAKLTLDNTGERMVPELSDGYTFWEHIYRYRFAAKFVKGLSVLDIACGEGYGSAALARSGAANVIGVDISPEACQHAIRKYGIDARVGSAENIPLPADSIDLVVSFETIEHLAHPQKFVDECARVLKPGGKAIISTPNRDPYRVFAPDNPYHCSEMSEEEFVDVLSSKFRDVQLYSQRLQNVTSLSTRAFASDRSRLHGVRGFPRLQYFLQRTFSPEPVSMRALEAARANPVDAIIRDGSYLSSIANRFSLRRSRSRTETAVYFIATATT